MRAVTALPLISSDTGINARPQLRDRWGGRDSPPGAVPEANGTAAP